MSVARAQVEISSAEFVEWMARDELPGIHSEVQRMAGMLAAVLANVNRDPRRRSQPFSPDDFFAPSEVEAKTDEQLLTEAMVWAAGINANQRPS